MSLYGIRNMQHSSTEVRVILGALLYKIKNSDPNLQFRLRELSMAIVGVLNSSPWIRDEFLSTISQKTPGIVYLDGCDDEEI
jgi:hypothetical protein